MTHEDALKKIAELYDAMDISDFTPLDKKAVDILMSMNLGYIVHDDFQACFLVNRN